jgi:hypothetical protein
MSTPGSCHATAGRGAQRRFRAATVSWQSRRLLATGLGCWSSSRASVRLGSPETTASTGSGSAPVDRPHPCAPLSCIVAPQLLMRALIPGAVMAAGLVNWIRPSGSTTQICCATVFSTAARKLSGATLRPARWFGDYGRWRGPIGRAAITIEGGALATIIGGASQLPQGRRDRATERTSACDPRSFSSTARSPSRRAGTA